VNKGWKMNTGYAIILDTAAVAYLRHYCSICIGWLRKIAEYPPPFRSHNNASEQRIELTSYRLRTTYNYHWAVMLLYNMIIKLSFFKWESRFWPVLRGCGPDFTYWVKQCCDAREWVMEGGRWVLGPEHSPVDDLGPMLLLMPINHERCNINAADKFGITAASQLLTTAHHCYQSLQNLYISFFK
jgi:hypothetical protein